MHKKKKTKLSTYGVIALAIVTFLVLFIGYEVDQKRETESTKITIAQEQEKKIKADEEKAKADAEKSQLEQKVKSVGAGKTIKYIPMGDSLTSGYFATTEENSFVNKFCDLLKNKMSFTYVDKGISKAIGNNHYGSILAGALVKENIEAVNSQQPDLITIEYGTNDCSPQNNVSQDTFRTQLNTLIDSVTINVNRDPTIVLLTTWGNSESSGKLDDVIIEVGKERNIPVVNLKPIYSDWNNKGPKEIQTFRGASDNFHPNDNGHDEIANAIYEKVEPLLLEKYKNDAQ